MKKLYTILALSFLSLTVMAAPLVTETPISGYGTPTTVSVSISAWTKVPAASSLSGRTGIIVSVPASSTANMVGHIASCTSTAIATSVRPMEFIKGAGFIFVPVEDRACLYLLSLNGSAENVHVQEVKQ